MSRTYNGHTLVELEEVCQHLEREQDGGLDSFYGDESESSRTVLALIERIRELGGAE
ncbi:hypothetical protein [Burkholderia cenocepacia]|uniref:hypothetical protein n=1 Tax=Burkholderia cenocepacia TaxID=95486 RepID=UPI0024B681A4|nr:hypothetical protein [Burkholderia cenocepacia]MDI9686591.1 hypothetical protein [Burkholderia cenocepacia]